MPRPFFSFPFALFLGVFFCGYSSELLAQNAVWNDVSNSKKESVSGVAKGKSKLKTYKEQLQKWGLDSNYQHAFFVGGSANTDGWSGGLYYLSKKKGTSSNLWSLKFSEIKHEKQIKQQGSGKNNPGIGNPTPYVFGKINNLYTLQLGYGKEKMILPGILDGNISLKFRYSGGLSLGMLKPYYLKLIYTNYTLPGQPSYIKEEKYSAANSDVFLSNNILGASKWSKVLNEIDYVPGAFFEMAFVLEPAKNKSFVQLITFGCNISYYAKALAIMADAKAYPYQANMFIGLSLGKRWK